MAFQAERHAQRLGVIDLIHLVDASVAFDTTDSACDVDGVIEVDEVGHFMDLDPGDGFAAGGAFADQGESGIVFEDLVMTVHAGGTGGDIGEPGFFDACMAVAAIHAELAGVCGVGESDRLNWLISDAGIFGCEIIPDAGGDAAAQQESAGNDQPRESVGPLWKNCRHLKCIQCSEPSAKKLSPPMTTAPKLPEPTVNCFACGKKQYSPVCKPCFFRRCRSLDEK